MIFLDFSQAFDTVFYRILLDRMSSTQLDKHIMEWVRNWPTGQAQRVMVTCHQHVPQGSILSPVLVNNFVNDLEAGVEEALSKFKNGTKLVGAVEAPSKSGRPPLQRHPTKSEGWAISSHLKFNMRKCWIRHVR